VCKCSEITRVMVLILSFDYITLEQFCYI